MTQASGGILVAPSLEPALATVASAPHPLEHEHRLLTISIPATGDVSPADNHFGIAFIAIPVIGGLIVGVMARWGSPAIRGHGIPEAMERVLYNESRVAPRLVLLKPLSSVRDRDRHRRRVRLPHRAATSHHRVGAPAMLSPQAITPRLTRPRRAPALSICHHPRHESGTTRS